MKNKIKNVIHGRVHVHIGKNGITEGVLKQIRTQLKSNKIIKIKFLTFLEFNSIEEATSYLEHKTNSKIIDIRGKTCVLMKKSSLT